MEERRAAVIYARVSTQEQADSRLSLDHQRTSCLNYASRQGYRLGITSVIRWSFEDAGVSAALPLLSRPFGSRLLQYDNLTVIALCQDRLFRSVIDMLATCERLSEKNIDFDLVDEGPLDLEDDERWMTAIMRAVFAEFERRRGVKRTRRAMKAFSDKGLRTGPAPYGFRNAVSIDSNGGKLNAGVHDLEPAEQIVIARIMELREGAMSFREIATTLNSEAILTREGCAWSHSQIRRIVEREMK